MRSIFCFKLFCCIFLGLNVMMNSNQSLAADADETKSGAAGANSAAVDALVAANNRFAIDLLHRLSDKPTENAFFSPYSISTALAMTWAGRRTETATQMAKALHVSEMSAADVTAAFGDLQKALAQTQAQTGANCRLPIRCGRSNRRSIRFCRRT